MRRWLARLAFALLVLAFALAWEGHRAAAGLRGPVAQGRVPLYYGGAIVLAGLGFAGLRERHRSQD
jgi:hypothetical protein